MSIGELRDELDEHQEDIEQVDDNEVVNDEQDIADEADSENQGDKESQDGEAASDDDLEFSFDEADEGDDPFAGQEAPRWVKDIRNENRELKRQQREWQQQQGQAQQQELRAKPTLDGHDYDSDAYEQDLQQWLDEKSQHEAKQQEQVAKYKQYDDNYAKAADVMTAKVPNYKELEQSIVDVLPESKQAMIKIACGDNSARMVVALSKSPEQLNKLSQMSDIEFVHALGKMESLMTTAKRNTNKPKPTSHKLQGSAGGGDEQLAKLEAEADKSGDRSKIHAYKRAQRNK